MDAFLEELRHKQERRREAGADDGATTNLYVSGLDPAVDEQALCAAFGRFGAVASVKIMWPRTDEERGRLHNSGFVSFMARRSAEDALRAMDGAAVGGHVVRVGWGRHVPVPARPLFVPDGGAGEADEDEEAEAAQCAAAVPTGQPFNARAESGSGSDGIAEVHVRRPGDRRVARLIHWTAEHVIRHGPEFECLLLARTRGDPRFRFLRDSAAADHAYYRWRMYSLLSGDTKAHWRRQMFFMYDRGPVWVPPPPLPPLPAAEPPGLGARARARLERRVRLVTGAARGPIAAAMAAALRQAHAADDVADVVCGALAAPGAAPGERLARLLLASDILHNCAAAPVAGAWRLRDAFAARLRAAFDCLGAAHRGIDARLKAEHFRRRVLAVLAVWEAWALFPRETIQGLAGGFL